MPGPQAPADSPPPAFSAGVVVARRDTGGWRLLVLRAYRNWDFPKGRVEPGETPLNAAIRETAEEAAISGLVFRWGEACCETEPYRGGNRRLASSKLTQRHSWCAGRPSSGDTGRRMVSCAVSAR